jgi:phosphoribosylformylglycinamidine synthase subunit PurL
MTVDCNGGYVYLDPYEGGKAAVTEACRNLAVQRRDSARRDGQSQHGQPAQAGIVLADRESVRGLAEGCKAFNAPVTGGNCSLYNQNPSGPIDPTPTVAVVGIVEKPEHVTTQWFKDEGDAIILLGEPVDHDPIARPRRQRVSASRSRQENRFAAALRFGNREDAAHHAARPDPIRPREKRA